MNCYGVCFPTRGRCRQSEANPLAAHAAHVNVRRPVMNDIATGFPYIPSTPEEVAKLEASYRPFRAAGEWRDVHVDEPRWARYAHILTRRARDAGGQAWEDTRDRLLRAAALESGALDGLFPANPELTTTVLARSISTRDAADDLTETIKVVAECHRRALILAGEAAADGRAVDANFMAVLQDVITESQATYTVTTEQGIDVEVDLPRRQYKPVSNYLVLTDGGLAVFTPASRVAAEMDRLTSEFASASFGQVHPAVQAAYAHYALTAIHPFADGNGRLARTVASLFLMRSAGVPLLVFADQWPSYYQAVAAAQAGAAQPLVDHVSAVAIATMDLAANLMAPRHRNLPRGQRPARRRRQAPPPSKALDDAARGLLGALLIQLREVLVSPPRGVRIAIAETRAAPDGHAENAYRMVADAGTGRFGVRVAARADGRGEPAAADLEFVALVSELPRDLLPVALRETRSRELFEVALADAYPLVLEQAMMRLRLWVQRLLTDALAPILPGARHDRPPP